MRQRLRRLVFELAMLALEANHVFQQGLGVQQFPRQIEQFQDALVVELDPALRVDHGHALLHVLQRGLQQRGLACQCGSAVAGRLLGFGQALLLQAQLCDVDMGIQMDGIHPGAGLHAHGAWSRQGQLEGRPGKAHHLAQGLQALDAGGCIGRACRCPCLAEHLLQRAAQGGPWIVQAVLQRKRGVHPGDGSRVVALHQPVGYAVEQGIQCPEVLRQAAPLALRVLGRTLLQAPQAQATHLRQRQRGHDQRPPVVLEGIGLVLHAVARDACIDVAVDALDLVRAQTPLVEAAQVVAVGLARVDMPGVLGEKPQKGGIPGQCAVLCIEQAHGNAQTIEHLPQGSNPVVRRVGHGGQARAVRRE